MNINKLSKKFNVKKLGENDISDMLNLAIENKIFYKHCPPLPTQESFREDLTALPPNKELKNKFFVGFYNNQELVAMCDFITDYPDPGTIFIGFFMLNIRYQGKGEGSKIITEVLSYLKTQGFKNAELAFIKGNTQSKNFWLKNGFIETGREVKAATHTKIVLNKKL